MEILLSFTDRFSQCGLTQAWITEKGGRENHIYPTVVRPVPPGSISSFSPAPSGDGLGAAGVNNFVWLSCNKQTKISILMSENLFFGNSFGCLQHYFRSKIVIQLSFLIHAGWYWWGRNHCKQKTNKESSPLPITPCAPRETRVHLDKQQYK